MTISDKVPAGTIHKDLARGKWQSLSLVEQMANIGSEVSRTINWKGKDEKDAKRAFLRALELIILTMKDPKNKGRLKEIARVKEMLLDWYLGSQEYKSTDKDWQNYFMQFAVAARKGR